MIEINEEERVRRWRMVLGQAADAPLEPQLSEDDVSMDEALTELYDQDDDDQSTDDKSGKSGRGGAGRNKSGGLQASNPKVARWLGDIRRFFPESVVSIMQRDALERLNIKSMLAEPELLATLTPDVNLVATLVSLSQVMPSKSKHTARLVVRKVADELIARLRSPTERAVRGALDRACRTSRPRPSEIDWNRTIRANLKHYQKRFRTIVPDRLIGFARQRSSLKDIIIVVDQSGSMATSVVYSGIFAAVLATIPAVNTRMVVFDTAVADLSDRLQDPVDVIFGTQLGGGTDINGALSYVETLITRPDDTILVLISDLFEGGNRGQLYKRFARIVTSGVKMVALLALNDRGAPAYDHNVAAHLAALNVPAFAATPDKFPEIIAHAIERGDMNVFIGK